MQVRTSRSTREWRLQRKGHPDHPAERDTAEGDAVDAEVVEQPDQPMCELVDRGRLHWQLGQAVAWMVVREHSKVTSEGGKLPLPELLRRSQRVRQHEDRSVLRAVQAVDESHVRDSS